MLTSRSNRLLEENPDALLVLRDQQSGLANLFGEALPTQVDVCVNAGALLSRLENGGAKAILLDLRQESTFLLECLSLIQGLSLPVAVHLVARDEPRFKTWNLPHWIHLHTSAVSSLAPFEELQEKQPLRVGDFLALIDASRSTQQLRLRLENHSELEVISHDGEVWSALLDESLGSRVLVDNLFETVSSAASRPHTGPPGQPWSFDFLENQILQSQNGSLQEEQPGRTNNVVPNSRVSATRNRKHGLTMNDPESRRSTRDTQQLRIQKTHDTQQLTTERMKENKMGNINETLEGAMNIEGARGAALADFDSGMCLGSQGGSASFDLEVAAAGNAEVVRSKHKVMSQLGLVDEIEDILISLGKEYHLIVPITGEKLFLYLALSRANANLALARHKARALVKDLEV